MKSQKQHGSSVQPVTALQLLKRKQHQRQLIQFNSATVSESACDFSTTTTQGESDFQMMNTITRVPPRLPLLIMKQQHDTASTASISSARHDHDHDNHEWLFLDGNNGITEISGEAGTGKTQICLSLCVTTVFSQFYEYECEYAAAVTNTNKGKENPNLERTAVPNPYKKVQVVPQVGAPPFPLRELHKEKQYYEAMYISMGETTSPAQIANRLHQMTSERLRHDGNRNGDGNGNGMLNANLVKQDAKNLMQRIHTRFIHNEEEFMELLNVLPSLLQKGLSERKQRHHAGNSHSLVGGSRIGLIVLDSVAGLFRTPNDDVRLNHSNKGVGNEQYKRRRTDDINGNGNNNNNNSVSAMSYYAQRSEVLFLISSKLKYISDRYGVNVVVVNQVTGKGGGQVVPSMGLSWSHCVNDRFLLSRRETRGIGSGDGNGCGGNTGAMKFDRKIHILASSRWRENLQDEFRIQAMGAVLSSNII